LIKFGTTTLRSWLNSGKVADLSDMAKRLDPKTEGIRLFARFLVPETSSARGCRPERERVRMAPVGIATCSLGNVRN
jgi:hypothetical protein